MKYPFHARTRVVILTAVGDIAAPTLAELNGGVDVTFDLVRNGLQIGRSTTTTRRTRWSSDVEAEDPTRYGLMPLLTGYRFTPPDDEPLWDAVATFRSPAVLVVRRGVPTASAWAAGQSVEVTVGRWGKRATSPSDNGPVTFSVPLLVRANNDAAVVAA